MHVNWLSLFALDIPVLEIVIRGTAIYFFLLLLMRLNPAREIGGVSLPDVLLIVLLADAAQNGMAGGYESISSGFVLIATLVFWAQTVDYLCYRFPSVRPIFQAARIQLVRNGELNRRMMRKEFIDEEDVMIEVRKAGLEDLAEVRAVYLESNGQISVIPS